MQISSDTRTFYERLGGEAILRQLVINFYQQMDSLDDVKPIRAMHAPDLANAEEKLFMFLSGWMGGPQLFIERFGHPRLRMRHINFAINESARDQWILCMKNALAATIPADKPLQDELLHALYGVADFMRNQ